MRLLYCFDDNHEVFQKSYRYVRPRNKLNPDTIRVFNNADGFFDDLPPL